MAIEIPTFLPEESFQYFLLGQELKNFLEEQLNKKNQFFQNVEFIITKKLLVFVSNKVASNLCLK